LGADEEKMEIMMTIELEKIKENKWRRTGKLDSILMTTSAEHSMKVKM